MIIWKIIQVTYYMARKKRKNIQKNDLWGLFSRSKLCENGPKISEKKYTAAHSIPDVTPRNK